MTFTVADAPSVGLLPRGPHFVMLNDTCVGVLTVSRNQERVHAERLADRAQVRTDYNGNTVADLAVWMSNVNNWRGDQK